MLDPGWKMWQAKNVWERKEIKNVRMENIEIVERWRAVMGDDVVRDQHVPELITSTSTQFFVVVAKIIEGSWNYVW